MLDGKKLRLTRGDQFNDPYDLNPYMVPLEWHNLVQIEKKSPGLVRSIAQEAFNRLSSDLYITCFSKDYMSDGSKLMWAHYGQSHSGVCMQIDFVKYRAITGLLNLLPIEVTYVKDLAKERNRRTPDSEDLPIYLATYKTEAWSYEQEVRVVVPSSSTESSKIKVDKDQLHAYIDFPLSCITRIVFGLSATPDNALSVVKKVKDLDINVKFERLIIDPVSMKPFAVEIQLDNGRLIHV